MSKTDILAGIIGSDGHIYKDLLSLCVVNKSKPFIDEIVLPLIQEVTGKNPTPKFVSSGYGDGKYKVHISSVKFNKFLMNRYNIPAGAKSAIIKPPNITNIDDKIDFMRGWIAGDGSVTKDRTRAKIEIWSKSKDILEWFKDALLEKGIKSTLFVERNKNEHILRIGRKEDMKSFSKQIQIPHPEKQDKLESFYL